MLKSELMVISVLLFLALMVSPAMAKSIGPQKAVDNPHFIITRQGTVEHLLPSGGANEWTANTELGAVDFVHLLDASKAKIPNAMPLTIPDLIGLMTNPEAALEFENKWGYISHADLVQLYIILGLSEEAAIEIASRWPEGAYVRFVNVGKNWNS